MTDKNMEIKSICRMCSHKISKNSLYKIFDKHKQKIQPADEPKFQDLPINIIQKYHSLIFKINENDGLPQQICDDCLFGFTSINEFLGGCIKSQKKLQIEYGKNVKNSTEKLSDQKNIVIKKKMFNKIENQNEIQQKIIRNTRANEAALKKLALSKNLVVQIEPIAKLLAALHKMSTKNIKVEEITDTKSNLIIKQTKLEIQDDYDDVLFDSTEFLENQISNEIKIENSDDENYFIDDFHEDFTITCRFCFKVAKNIIELEEHEQKRHKQKFYNKYLLCEHCGDSIKNYLFSDHVIATHEGISPYTCDVCGKAFQRFRSYKEHMLKYHQIDRTKDNNKPSFPCQGCNRIYLSKGVLQHHIKTAHSGCTSNKNLKITYDRIIELPKFKCDICGLNFRNIISMEKHRNNHSYEKYEHKHGCPECDRKFGRRDHLKYHIKSQHLKETPHKCEVCGKAYAVRNQLNAHMKLHEKKKYERRAHCDECKKSFHNNRYLKRHKQEVHCSDEQFVCVICNLKFFKKNNLYKHAEIHNSEKIENVSKDKDNYDENIVEYVEDEIKYDSNEMATENEIQLAVSVLVSNDDDNDEAINRQKNINTTS